MFSLLVTFVSSSRLNTPVQRHVSLATSEVLLPLDADLHPGEEGGAGPAHGHQLQLARLVPLPQLGQPPLVGRHPRRQLLAPPRVLLVVEQRQEVRQGLCVQPRGGLRVPRTVRGDGLHSAGEVTTQRPREVRSGHLGHQHGGLLETVLTRQVLQIEKWMGEEVLKTNSFLRTSDQTARQ